MVCLSRCNALLYCKATGFRYFLIPEACSLLDAWWGRHVLATPRWCVILFLRCGLWLLRPFAAGSQAVETKRPDFRRKVCFERSGKGGEAGCNLEVSRVVTRDT